MSDILATLQGKMLFMSLAGKLMGGMMDMNFTKEQLLDLNAKLNKIKKPKDKKK